MPGLNDPNDSAFTDPSQNGYWKWNAQKRSWEPNAAVDPINHALWGAPEALGLKANQIFADEGGSYLNLGMAADDRSRMAGLLSQLQTQAQTGGGAWEQALKQNTEANNNAATAIGQTLGGDAMSAGRAIGNARAGNEQRAVGQGNLLRAQSQQTAQGQIADILGGQGALDAQSAAGQASAAQGLLQANRSLEAGAANNRQKFAGSYAQMLPVGRAHGGAIPRMSDGGEVPGTPKVFGDDERNDTVPAMLSPDEIVIPISITSRPDAPEAAARFVAAVQGRAKPGQTNFAPGGEVPTFGDTDTGSESLARDPTSNVLSVRPTTGPVPTAAQLDPFASQTQEASIANGGLLDTTPYASTREAALGNAGNFMTQFLGGGPSVAPQAMQNATDSTIADAFRARGPGVVQGAAEQLQGAAGNAAGLVAGESQRGAAAFAEAVQRQRAQDIALATAQQQAAWRNSLMNAGIGLEQQAQLRNLLGSAGQGAVAMGGMFDMEDGPSHSSFSSDRSALETGYDRGSTGGGGSHSSDMGHSYDAEHYAEGGVVAHLARKPEGKRKRSINEVGARKPEQGSPEEWKGFPEPPTKKQTGTQTEDEVKWNFADGGAVPNFYGAGPGLPQPGPFAPQPQGIPGALQVLASILRPPGGPDMSLPEPRMMTPQEIAAADERNAAKKAPPLPHAPDMTQRPFATPASRAPMPAPPTPLPASSPAPPLTGSPKPPAAPKADPYADQQKAAAMKAETDASLAMEQAGILGGLQQTLQENAIAQKEVQTRAREEAEAGLAQIQQAREELKNIDTTVDQGRYMNSRGWAGKVSAIIGLALGAIGNDNGINRPAQLLNQAIDRDIDAQKASFELALRKGQSAVDSAQSIYALSRQMTQDDIAANLAAKGTALDLAKNQVDIAAAKAGAPQAKANLMALSAQIAIEKQKADESLRQRGFDNSIKRMGAEADMLRAQAAAAAGQTKAEGKVLPAETAAGIADLPVAMKQLEGLGKRFKDLNMSGIGGRIGSAVAGLPGMGGTDSAQYNAEALLAMQGVGKIMEGGKLAAGDEAKYRNMLPKGGDSEEVAQQKISKAKSFLNDLVVARKKFLSESGYKVPGNQQTAEPTLMTLPSGEVVEVR